MPTLAIRAEGLSKRYTIGPTPRRYRTLRESLATVGLRSLLRLVRGAGAGPETFWALKEVSFEVAPGEVVGIIGRNGAGKSTLLKILSRITEPTEGRAEIRGRVGSLLEVGTGFHPELTGRENVFLSGAILGMRRAEIDRKFDEIVAFAEVERFVDTPVKHYSSGMYVRLAFAVAAHLEPEILIVDEVLAVGDLQFQKKCLGKMEQVSSSEGRTILLVSHNMTSILGLATRCFTLAQGRLVMEGPPAEVVAAYQGEMRGQTMGRSDLTGADRYGTGQVRFLSVHTTPLGPKGEPLPAAITGCDLLFETSLRAAETVRDITVGLTLHDELGNRIVDVNTVIKGRSLSLGAGEEASVSFLLRNVRLKPDVYCAALWAGIANHADMDGVRYASAFRMEARREDILYTAPFPGVYACEYSLEIRKVGSAAVEVP